jgi:HemY protein
VIRWQGWRVDTTVPVLALTLAVAVALAIALVRVLAGFIRAPRRWLAERRARRTRKGYQALSDGLAAIAAGDKGRATRLARRADKLLADPALTGLLGAQAAELTGDEAEARRRLEAMVVRPETAFLGLKGLMDQALKHGDRDAARAYGERAFALNPAAEGLAVALFELQAECGDWAGAERTVAEAKRRKALAGAELLSRHARVLAAQSQEAEAAGEAGRAETLAIKAHHADPMLPAPAIAAARLLAARGKRHKAETIIERTYAASADPALVEAWLGLIPAEGPLDRVKRLERLVKANPDGNAGHLALAEAALAAKLWGQARTHLELVAEREPGARVFTLLARVERDERKDEGAAQAWEAKAAQAAG